MPKILGDTVATMTLGIPLAVLGLIGLCKGLIWLFTTFGNS